MSGPAPPETKGSEESTAKIPNTAPSAPSSRAYLVEKLRNYVRSILVSFNIGHLLLILLALHIFAMSFPNDGGKVFDESYYVTAANNLLSNTVSNLEHPFLGKAYGALGILIFGNTFFGWRIFYVIFGILTVWVFYGIARLFFSKEKALLAASFLGFETLFFIHSSLLLLEGPPLFFGLLGFYLYFKKRYYLSALALGLSILSKEWGIYFVAALFIYHVLTTRRIAIGLRPFLKILVFSLIIVAAVLIPLQWYDTTYHVTINDSPQICQCAIQNVVYYYDYHSSLTITNYSSISPWNNLAWNWILPITTNTQGHLIFNSPAPMGYFVTTITVTVTSGGQVISTKYLHPVDWQGIGNLAVWWAIWIIVPVVVWKLLKGRASELDIFVGSWIFATYAPSLLLSIFYHRIVYPFYFINVDPGLALGIPLVITFIAPESPLLQRILSAVWLGAAIFLFIVWFPIHPLDGLSG